MQTIQICLILFTNTFILYMLRVNVSTIVLSITPRAPNMTMSMTNAMENNRLTWNHREQSIILCAYGLGAAITSIPSVTLARKYSSEKIILFSNYGSVLMTLLCGFLAFVSNEPTRASQPILGLLIVFRLFIGLFAGASYPCTFYLISDLVPVKWRARTLLVALVGSNIGAAVTNVYCGRLADNNYWYKGFFVSGLVALALVVLWAILITLRPQDSYKKDKQKTPEFDKVPYKEILGSKPFIALLILHFTNMYGLYFFLMDWPTFYTYFEEMTITEIGDFTAVGFAIRTAGAIVVASLSFYMVNGVELNGIQRTLLRKVFVFLSHIFPGIIFIVFAAVFLKTHIKGEINKERLREGCTGIYYSSLMLNGAIIETSFINSFELSPNYGPYLFAIINTLGNLAGFIEPLIFGCIKFDDPTSHTPWLVNFYLIGVFYLLGGVVFIALGKANPEPWNIVRTKAGGLREITFPTQRTYFTSLVLPAVESERSFNSELSGSTRNSISRVSSLNTSKYKGDVSTYKGDVIDLFTAKKKRSSKAKDSLRNDNISLSQPSHQTVANIQSGSSAGTSFKTMDRSQRSLTEVASSSTTASSVRQKYQYTPTTNIIIEEDEQLADMGESSARRMRSGNISEANSSIKDDDTPIITYYLPHKKGTKKSDKKIPTKEATEPQEQIILKEPVEQQPSTRNLGGPVHVPIPRKTKSSSNKSKRNYVEISARQEPKYEERDDMAGESSTKQFTDVENYYGSSSISGVQKIDGPSTSQAAKADEVPILSTIDLYKQKSGATSLTGAGSSQYTQIDQSEKEKANKKAELKRTASDSTIQTTGSTAQRSKRESETDTSTKRKYYLMKKF